MTAKGSASELTVRTHVVITRILRPLRSLAGYIKEAKAKMTESIRYNWAADGLEREALDAFSSMFPPVFAIGPLQLLEEKQIPKNSELENKVLNMWTEDLDCLTWLDKKEPSSVIYVNFGSVARMSSKELLEFGWGLANSKQIFLRAIRPDLVLGEFAIFPSEFEAEIKDRGLLHWGLGMEITNAKREEVERVVRDLMIGENGKMMKAKAVEWKKVAEDAVNAPTGSSCIWISTTWLTRGPPLQISKY
ncbi:UDP-glycosyltransferase 85A1-like [Rhododendron vialii]|uniref:UDP-glycosyltransferase 85A1-like n=1 Tax=Rhododendron vialii TaxID=182163 RepID=UPI00265D8B21|nr:UDP-glycosyltransferase 85A1-like [Rhododendron vialii]